MTDARKPIMGVSDTHFLLELYKSGDRLIFAIKTAAGFSEIPFHQEEALGIARAIYSEFEPHRFTRLIAPIGAVLMDPD